MKNTTAISQLASILFCLSMPTTILHAASPESVSSSESRKALNPALLVKDMRKALAYIAKNAATAQPPMSPKSREARPFWTGLKTISKGLDQMENSIHANDEEMADGLRLVGEGFSTSSTAWVVLRGANKNSPVARGLLAFSKSYDMYLLHYGPAAARMHRGDKLSQAEFAQVAKSYKDVRALNGMLKELSRKVKQKSYQQRLVVDLVILSNQVLEVKVKSVKDYCKFIYRLGRLTDAMASYDDLIEDWYPQTRDDWSFVTTHCKSIGEIWVYCDSYYKGWEYSTVSIEHYGSYYESTEIYSSVTTEETTTYESTVESYSEETATEESTEESESLSSEVTVDENDSTSLSEEIETDDNQAVSDDGDAGDDGVADEIESSSAGDDSAESDGGGSEAEASDGGGNDGGGSDAGASDGGGNDGGGSDAGASDGGGNDGGGSDAGASDGGGDAGGGDAGGGGEDGQ